MKIKDLILDYRSLKEGDEVYSLLHGWLVVHKIEEGSTYAISCRRKSTGQEEFSFTYDFKYESSDSNISLYNNNPFDYLEEKENTDVFIPKVMEVSEDNTTWLEKYVVFKSKEEGVITASALSQGGFNAHYWKYSREKTTPTKQVEFTLEELAKLAGLDPELIRLKP